MKESYAKIEDYTSTIDKRELIKGELKEEKNAIFKFKKPASFYMKMTEGKSKGAQIVFIKGKYDDKLQVRPGGLLKFAKMSLDPKGDMVMESARHPIWEADMGHIIRLIEENYQKAKAAKEENVSYQNEEILDGRKTMLFKAVFPKDKDYYGHIISINIDSKLFLPVKITVYDWDKNLLEMYYYRDIKINVGLSDQDFKI